ncbi:MAG: hypothetical protein E6K13_02770 [Methanobacteriota archaeon]|nr:MAG: hypothetical protein E6K13_02770 [Euryarchaeota archaeon]
MAVAAPWAVALADAIHSEDAEAALRAGLSAVGAKVAPAEIVRLAALAYAEAIDASRGTSLRGLLALSSAVRLMRHLSPRIQPLPVLRAIALAAADKKLPAAERPRRVKVSGEISHLTRSFEYAIRAGEVADATSIFSGLLTEGKERVMAGDILFRVVGEDMVEGGHKLVYAVKAWRLASALGWRRGDLLMGPVIARVATGIQDDAAYKTLMGIWGKEKVDIAALGSNAGPAEGEERDAILAALRGPSPEECAKGVIIALKGGVALDALASVVVREAAVRVASSGTYDLAVIGALVYADAARWVLKFSRTESRVLPLLQACLLLRSQPARRSELRTLTMANEAAILRDIVSDIEAGKDLEAAELAHTFLVKGAPMKGLIELLIYELCKEGPAGHLGYNLTLADAAAEEATAYPSRIIQAPVALARALAQSPKDRGGWPAIEELFGPPSISS